MERRRSPARIEIEIGALTIDEAKEAYIVRQKGVTFVDILDASGNEPHYFVSQNQQGLPRYAMVGRTNLGRYVLVAVAHVQDESWRVVTACWLNTRRGRRLYEEE